MLPSSVMLDLGWKRGALGALAVLGAVLNLRCGNTSNDLFQGGSAGFTPGGMSGTSSGGGGSPSIGGADASGGTGLGGSAGSSSAGSSNAGASGDAGASGSAGASGNSGAGGNAGASGNSGAGGSGGGAGAGGSAGAGASGSGGMSGGSAGASGNSGASGSAGAGGNAGASGSGGNAGASGSAGAGGSGGSGGNAGGGAGVSGSAGASGGGGTSGGGGAATGGSGGTSGGNAGAGGSAGTGVAGASGSGGAGGCSGNSPTFTPRAPIVELVVDRSSTMFENNYWAPVRTSVLDVVSALQDQIKFGFSAYTGVIGSTCPLDLVSAGAPALNAYSAISASYGALGSAGIKSESPTADALAAARAALDQSAASGPKYVFLITDGGQDFCNDGNASCASDAVVYELQALQAAGITSEVFGLKNSAFLTNGDLQNFSNAGAGAAVGGNAASIYFACHDASSAWTNLWSSLGRAPNQALGSYQANGGSTPLQQLDTANPDSMDKTLLNAAAALKSCTFDVSGGGIDVTKAAQGSVTIDGMNVPLNVNNGWHLTSSSVLVLSGSACSKWQSPSSTQIAFAFPCGTFL